MTRLRLLAVLPVTALLVAAYLSGYAWPILGGVRSVCRRNPEYEPDVVG